MNPDFLLVKNIQSKSFVWSWELNYPKYHIIEWKNEDMTASRYGLRRFIADKRESTARHGFRLHTVMWGLEEAVRK